MLAVRVAVVEGHRQHGALRAKLDLDAAIGKPIPKRTLHDIRRTCVTMMCEIGIPPHVVEAIVNHTSGHRGGVAGVYNHAEYAKQKAEALQPWADHLLSIVGA